MQVFNINSTIFTAKTNPQIKKFHNNIKKQNINKKDVFYDDINKFLTKEYSKEEYLTSFIKNVENNAYLEKNSNIEKKYINDLLTSIDLTNNYKDIPNQYIIDRMLKLLGNK